MNDSKEKDYYQRNWFYRYFFLVNKIEIFLSFITCFVIGYFFLIFNFPNDNLIKGYIYTVIFWFIVSALAMMVINSLDDKIDNFLAGRRHPTFFGQTVLYFFIFGLFLHWFGFWNLLLR
jgi:hypothetical protein